MTIRCSGKAKILIPETGEVLEVSPDDLEWEIGDDSEERQMGAEIHYYSSVYLKSEEGHCVEAEWDVWEYPIGDIECANVQVQGGELIEDFDDIWSTTLDDDYNPYEDQFVDQIDRELKAKEQCEETTHKEEADFLMDIENF